MPDLELDVRVGFPGFTLELRDTFELEGVTALFGPSGAGKTTLLSTVAGLVPANGRVRFGEHVWEQAGQFTKPWKRPIGFVFQHARLFEHMSVGENLAFAAHGRTRSSNRIAPQAIRAATDVDALLTRRPQTLSGGERKRVAIARALAAGPELLLMDEPLAGLDRAAAERVLALVRELPSRFATPVLYVSHTLGEITEVSDRLIALDAGRVVARGATVSTLATLGPEMTGRFEAGAILTGIVRAHDEQLSMLEVDVSGTRMWLPAGAPQRSGETLRLRVRARDVSIAINRIGDVSIRNQLPVTIERIDEDEGAYAELMLRTTDSQQLRARLTRLAVAELGLRRGMSVIALIKAVAFDRKRGPSAE